MWIVLQQVSKSDEKGVDMHLIVTGIESIQIISYMDLDLFNVLWLNLADEDD